MRQLNWKLILYFSLFGPFMGVLIVLGAFPEGMERYAWLAFVVVSAVVLVKRREPNLFPHGALIGFLSGATSTLVQGVFARSLAENNPWMVERFDNMPEGFDFQFFIMMLVPFIGVASALIGGLMTVLFSKILPNEGDSDGA